jgi:hypothetical protein
VKRLRQFLANVLGAGRIQIIHRHSSLTPNSSSENQATLLYRDNRPTFPFF